MRRQEERVAPRSWAELLDTIRSHRVQEARAVLTGYPNFAAAGDVQPRRGREARNSLAPLEYMVPGG